MVSYIPMYGVAYVLFLLANLFGLTGFLFDESMFSWTLPSGKVHNPTWSYIVILIGIIMLFVELTKSTKTNNQVLIDHGLSTVVFIAFVATYISVPWAGNSVFFTFMMFSLMDVFAGFVITVKNAKRDIGFPGQ